MNLMLLICGFAQGAVLAVLGYDTRTWAFWVLVLIQSAAVYCAAGSGA